MMVYDGDGHEIGELTLSDNQARALKGTGISVLYHTPRTLASTMAPVNGVFSLELAGGRVVTQQPDKVREYIALQRAIAAVQEPT